MARQGARRRPRGPRQGPNMFLMTLLVLLGTALGGSAVLFGPQVVDNLLNRDDPIGSQEAEPGSLADGQLASEALARFAAALEAGDVTGIGFAGSTAGTAPAEFAELTQGLGAATVAVDVGEPVMVSADGAQAPISLTWTFANGATWTTSSQVALEAESGQWQVRWDPAVLEPSLQSGDSLRAETLAGPRAPILGRNGAVLVQQVDLVRIGIRPSRVQDLPSLVATLQSLLGVDPAELSARVGAAPADAFVDVAVVPRPDYDAIRDQIFPLPGTVFREFSEPRPVEPDLARALLGRSGEVTAEIIDANPGLFQPGDIVGLSGLQAAYNAELAGRPGLEITVVRGPGSRTTQATGTGLTTTSAIRDPAEPEVLYRAEPEPGRPVVTTIDPAAQRAAEAALDRTPLTSALVAIEISTGHVVALANGPRGATVNLAATGQYPPGSTFKVVSGYAVLRDVLAPGDTIDCPVRVDVGGRSFGNAEDEVLGPITFRSAFAHSCNTAFVNATRGFGPSVLHDTALQFGLGADYDLGIDAYAGSVPVNDSDVDLAASAFGQGRVLVSPLSAAVMAASAAGSAYRSPLLVTSPAPAPQTVEPLDPVVDGVLGELMRAVVTEGTGRAVLNVAGGPVHGKTGTAEFGNDTPPRSHAWFVGYQGDLAFAVFVEAGEFGGATAAPIAADFLNALAAQG